MDKAFGFLEEHISKVSDEREKAYLSHRLMQQLDYFGQRSIQNKQRYQNMKIRTIVLSSLIPVAVAYADSDAALGFGGFQSFTVGHVVKLAVGVTGALVAIWESVAVFKKYRESWVEFRITHETLLSETWRYIAQQGDYADDSKRFDLLVQNIEGILATENMGWKTVITETKAKES